MKIEDFVNILDDCCNDITFRYNGKASGIMPEVNNYKKTYHMWHGNREKDYSSIDSLMEDKFFGGRSLREIYNEIDIMVA